MSEPNEVQEVYSHEQLSAANQALLFRDQNPDYYPTEANFDRLMEYLDQMNWAVTVESLQKAYQVLSEAGQLEVRPKTRSEKRREELQATIAEQREAAEQLRQAEAEAEAAELKRRREMPLSELKKLTRMEISRAQKSSKDGIVHTAYPNSKINQKHRGQI